MSYPVLCLLIGVWLTGLTAGSYGVGRTVLRKMVPSAEADPVAPWLALGLGWAALSYIVFILAAVHVLTPRSLAVLSVIWILAGALGWPWIRRRWPVAKVEQDWVIWLFGGMIAVMAGLNLLPALTPAVDWDGLAYHLALPKIYLAAHGFVFRPDIFHNLFPQFAEMLYTLGLLFPWGVAPKVLHAGFGLLAAAAVIVLGQRTGLQRAAWFGGAVFYSQFLVHIESGTAFVDLVPAAYLALAVLAVVCANEHSREPRWLYLAGFLAGIAGAVKWHGLILAAMVMLLLLRRMWLTEEKKTNRIRQSFLLVFWTGVPAAPYLLRAWLMGGNPVWPLAYSLFGGREWHAALAQQITRLHATFAGVETGWRGWLRLPLDLVQQGAAFGVGGPQLRWPLIGLALLAGLWVVQRIRRRHGVRIGTGVALVLALGYGLIWFMSSPQIRFLVPLFPLVAWLAARAAAEVWQGSGRIGQVGVLAAGLLLFAVHPPLHRSTGMEARVILGQMAPEAYCVEWFDLYPACQFLNQTAASQDVVLLFGDNRGFYLDRPYLWGDPAMQAVVDYRALPTPGDLAARLDQLNIRWVIFRTDLHGPEYLAPDRVAAMHYALEPAGEPVWVQGPVAVYRRP